MDPRTVGLVGGVAGGMLGVLGGLVGTYFGIRNSSGARERGFAIRVAALIWVVVTIYLVGSWLLPFAYRQLLGAPFFLSLPWFIHLVNRRQEQIRREEASAG